MKYIFQILFGFTLVLSSVSSASRVIELSDKFLDVRQESQWFVMFYAPWCAHCKRFEPVWAHVAQSLFNTNIRVGRVDCTRFTAVAKSFKIQSYPTILFVKGDREHVYTGDRDKDELISFAVRLSGPPVQQITRVDSIELLKTNNPIFFVYVGKQNGVLWDTYYSVSEIFQPHGFFYVTTEEIAKRHFEIDTHPAVLVYKERNHYYYPLSNDYQNVEPSHLNTTLHQWVNEERFPTFPKITRSNINHLMQTKKYLVLAVVEENKLSEIAAHELEFRDMVEMVIRKNRDKFHKKFQFGWVGTPDLAHSIAMDTLPTPHLIVFNSTSSEHHIPDDEPLQLTQHAIVVFLENIHSQNAPTYGGNSFFIRLYRNYFEAKQSLRDIWRGNPVLTSVLFGLPLGFLSLIIYSICCADIMDAEEEDDTDDHEKKE